MKKNKNLDPLIKEALKKSFTKDKLDHKKVTGFVKLFKKLPTSQAIYVLNQFKKSLKLKIDNQTLTIESPISLPVKNINQIKSNLTKRYTLNAIRFQLNPSLLGGIRVKIGDTVFDASLKRKIEEVGEAICQTS